MDTKLDRPLLSVPEAAALAGLSRSVAYRLAEQDRLPGLVKLPGRRLLVRRRVLEAWLAGIEAGGLIPQDVHGPSQGLAPPSQPGGR